MESVLTDLGGFCESVLLSGTRIPWTEPEKVKIVWRRISDSWKKRWQSTWITCSDRWLCRGWSWQFHAI